jgi:cysteinyl-tRNA synthetase
MPQFTTSTGTVDVANWGYQLQKPGGLDAADLAQVPHDLIVMDFSADGSGATRFSQAEIDAIKDGPGGRSVAVAYMSIGEASEFRDHWDSSWTDNGLASGRLSSHAPDWLGPTNPDWPESRKVRYWDPDWQDVIYNDARTGWLDEIVSQGFDAAYLDIVDAYYYWAEEAPASVRHAGDPAPGDDLDSARRMIDFIVDFTAHARQTNPEFFVILQNGAYIMDALDNLDAPRKEALLDAIGAIAVEDTYYRGNRDQNNNFRPDQDKIKILQDDFLNNDIPVFVVDYVNTPRKINGLQHNAIGDGFIPFAAHNRDLATMDAPLSSPRATRKADFLQGGSGNDILHGLNGSDILEGLDGADKLFGGLKADWLYGGAGKDILRGGKDHDHLNGGLGSHRLFGHQGNEVLGGGKGADYLVGGAGRDRLVGGAGHDVFVFAKNAGQDRILDFEDGTDRVKLHHNLWDGTLNAAQVVSRFGTQNGDNFVLEFDGGERLVLVDTTEAELLGDVFIF